MWISVARNDIRKCSSVRRVNPAFDSKLSDRLRFGNQRSDRQTLQHRDYILHQTNLFMLKRSTWHPLATAAATVPTGSISDGGCSPSFKFQSVLAISIS